MSIRERIISTLVDRRNRIFNGKINCIPCPFKRFETVFPGIEQGCYYLVSGATKAGKTQLANYMFLYNTVLYSYYHPETIKAKIFYFPLEETPEAITLRFMAFLLNHITDGQIRISPTDLKSTNKNKPLPENVLDVMNSETFVSIMDFYEKCVDFEDQRNPTGIWKVVKNYAENNGKTVYKTVKVKDELGQEVERKKFDYYVPNNPDEYVIIITDHVSLLESERGMDLRQTINKYSEYMIIFRNRYNYIPVCVQQQSTETNNLDAFKSNKIRPTVSGLSDSKYTAKDCNIMLGITNPYSFEMSNYQKYDITKLKGKARFLEVVINRNGEANNICPLFFDGAINNFTELPLPDDTASLNKVYNYINPKKNISFFIKTLKTLIKK